MTYFIDGQLGLLKLDFLKHRLVRWCHEEGAMVGSPKEGGASLRRFGV